MLGIYLKWKDALFFIDEGYKVTREEYLNKGILYIYKNTKRDDVIYAVDKKGEYPWDPEPEEFFENTWFIIT